VLATVVLLGTASQVRAQLVCGGTVGPGGTFVLTEDLDCREVPACQVPGGCSPVLTVVGKAVLDLAGHRITCDSFTDDGVVLTGTGATLRNGQVNLCGTGVRLVASGRHVVENVVSSRSGSNGFSVIASDDNRLENNVADTSGGNGFNLSGASGNKLTGNVATRTETFNGFNTSGGSDRNRFQGNLAVANGNNGFNVNNDANKLVGNTAVGNDGDGFDISGSSNLLKDNRAASNGSAGVSVGGAGMVNFIDRNISLDNVTIDMEEGVACDNVWRRNVFGSSDLPDCVQ
jgi:parallel beta-helix repeat protein